MDLTWKLLLIVFSISILSVYTSIFRIVKQAKGYGKFYSRLTAPGKIYCILVVGLIILNVFVEFQKDKEDMVNKQNLQAIKDAIIRSGLRYDSVANTIVNTGITIQDGGLNISGSTVSEMHDIYTVPAQKQYVDKSTGQVVDYELLNEEQLKAMYELVETESKKINSKCVYLFALYAKQQQKVMEQVAYNLNVKGYNVLRTGIWNPRPSISDLGIAVEQYENCIAVYIGRY